jgi:site-specific DNA-methyltransferase (adenine-specific)
MDIETHTSGELEFLHKIDDNTVDLILTKPPYGPANESDINPFYSNSGNEKNIQTCVDSTEWGQSAFTLNMTQLEELIRLYYKKLKKGGTCIIWIDVWKAGQIRELMDQHMFKQIRFIEWIKTNNLPRTNTTDNYLSNVRESAVVGTKEYNSTFNSTDDNGIYMYPTSKSLKLYIDLITKHSNEGDLVIDIFSEDDSTESACKIAKRRFKGYRKACIIKISLYRKN